MKILRYVLVTLSLTLAIVPVPAQAQLGLLAIGGGDNAEQANGRQTSERTTHRKT